MKKARLNFFKLTCVTLCMSLASATSMATTYTAVLSGNFSSSTTWGGSVPPSILSTDNIVVPSGVNVVLDNNATVSGALSTLTVNGTLTSTGGVSLILNNGTLTGNGTITVDSISTGLMTGLTFTGSIIAKRFTSIGTTVSNAANIAVSENLTLSNGILNMAAGTLTVSNNAMITVSGGTMTTSGGSIGLNNVYHVRYLNASATAGLELTGSGLHKIMVDVSSANSVTLSSDLNMNDTLTLTSGMLVLNGNDLSFNSNGNFATAGTGTISATSASDISIMAMNNFAGGLRFTSSANTVNNFTVNTTAGAMARLGSNLTVNGMLNMQAGKLNIGGNSISIATGGSLGGGSSTSYIVTELNGNLNMNLSTGGTNTYHVGTSTRYAPAVIVSNAGSASGMVAVGVNDLVFANGTSGATLSLAQPLVNATWYVSSTMTSNINLNMQLMWDANMEVNGFTRAASYISHYSNGSWDVMTNTAASVATNGMFTLTRSNITSLSPFAVMDKNTSTGIQQVNADNKVVLYPNPVVNTLYFTGKNVNRVDIYDMTGRLMTSNTIDNNNSVSITDLQTGVYTARFYGSDFTSVQQFVKQ